MAPPKPKKFPLAPAPTLPTPADPEVAAAAQKARAVEISARGRKSTILTGSQGFEERTKKKTLLGA